MATRSRREEDGLSVPRGEAAVHGLVPKTVLGCRGATHQIAASYRQVSGLSPPESSVLPEYGRVAGESAAFGTPAGESWGELGFQHK